VEEQERSQARELELRSGKREEKLRELRNETVKRYRTPN
jgi:hypothetical protein